MTTRRRSPSGTATTRSSSPSRPPTAPQIALGILVENGGHGGATAAPIAREVFDYYLLGKLPEKAPDLNPDALDD